MWRAAFARFPGRLIRAGDLAVVNAGQPEIVVGGGAGPRITVRMADAATLRRLFLDPELAPGQRYVDGALRIDADAVQRVLALLNRNRVQSRHLSLSAPALSLLPEVPRRPERASMTRSRRNVAQPGQRPRT